MADISLHAPTPPTKWFVRFADAGLVAKGIVYCLVGLLAFRAAFEIGNSSSRDSSRSGVFSFVLEQPFGQVLLALIAVGLACYTGYRLIEALNDTSHKGSDLIGGIYFHAGQIPIYFHTLRST